jgi:hypothetical protein
MSDILAASAITTMVILGTFYLLKLVSSTINKIEKEENNLND